MSETRLVSWHALPNPFLHRARRMPAAVERNTSNVDGIKDYVSGRSADITEILIGAQSAILLLGSSRIGKSALINYLEDTPGDWSWRKELSMSKELSVLQGQMGLDLEATHFARIDLTPLENEARAGASKEQLEEIFQRQCAYALLPGQPNKNYSFDLLGLRSFLRQTKHEQPLARYYVMLDTIERLARDDGVAKRLDILEKTEQERGLALLTRCQAIRTLVDLLDEHTNFGVILAIEALPLPSIAEQFAHVSVDLARFTTMTLSTFSWDDARRFLRQGPESFGSFWAGQFQALDGAEIFSEDEQNWLLEQAGTHPYLLQQFCFYAFRNKQRYAAAYGKWLPLEESSRQWIVDSVTGHLSTFLLTIRNRIEESMKLSSEDTRRQFYQFLLAFGITPNQCIEVSRWNQYSSELRHILAREGVVCFDELDTVRYPGAVLLHYLIQEARKSPRSLPMIPSPPPTATPTNVVRNFWLTMTLPDRQPDRLMLSELEYHLINALLRNPQACSAAMLKQSAWSKPDTVSNSALTQRMHQLRKKLKKQCGEVEVIENRYGGQYVLKHPEWFQIP